MTSFYPDAVRPDVVTEMLSSFAEEFEAEVGCLRDAGFDVVVEDDGYTVEYPNEQDEAFTIAQYVCKTRFEVDPVLSGLIETDETRNAAYDEVVGVMVPCLEAQGFAVTDVPSRGVFVERMLTGDAWSPWAQVFERESPERVSQLTRACMPE